MCTLGKTIVTVEVCGQKSDIFYRVFTLAKIKWSIPRLMQAWIFIFKRARPFHFVKGISIGKSLSLQVTFNWGSFSFLFWNNGFSKLQEDIKLVDSWPRNRIVVSCYCQNVNLHKNVLGAIE